MKFDELYLNGQTYGITHSDAILPFLHLKPFGICQKCAGKTTRRHHRKCALRGEGHKGREGLAREVETRAVERCSIVVHVRRGRHGKGLSLPAAEEKVLRVHVMRTMRPVSFVDLIKSVYGPDVKIETIEPGTVSITTDIEADPKPVIDGTLFGIRVIVNGVEL